MKFVFTIAFILSVALPAISAPKIIKLYEEEYKTMEIIDEGQKNLEVSVDYFKGKACQARYMYELTKINDSKYIVTRTILANRAFCPDPEHWPVLELGIKFTISPNTHDIYPNVIVPGQSQVEVKSIDKEMIPKYCYNWGSSEPLPDECLR